ncbi:MAG: sulfurtransferase [Quisquiliibacterium sp.]
MNWTKLISPEELATIIDRCVVIDCRHNLLDPDDGPSAYAAQHLPGARFLHQDTDLAGPKNGRNGRHPLPEREQLAARLRAAGLNRDQQLVAYDDHGGMYAGRLWWLARWLGHQQVAVLDGGMSAWKKAGFPTTAELPSPTGGDFNIGDPLAPLVTVERLNAQLGSGELLVVDARARERYAGQSEPIDPVAGHIPGALNRPFQSNLRPDGRFKPAEVLRREFEQLIGHHTPSAIVHSCGSGVTACHNLLAMELAGISGSALYGGSWSEWCGDPARPVATGDTP